MNKYDWDACIFSYLSAKYYLSIFSSRTTVGIQDILRKNLHGNAQLNLSSKAPWDRRKWPLKRGLNNSHSLKYGLSAKNIGRCGEVAVSGTSTVLATLNVPPASQPASRKGLDVLAGKTDSERHSEQSEAINLVPRSLVDESRRRCYSDVDTPAFWASSYP